jgi:hypothetical protein
MTTLGRIVRNGSNGFGLVELDQVKQDQLVDLAIQKNLEILQKCVKNVHLWLIKNNMHAIYEHQLELALAVYQAVCLKVSSLWALELARQVRAVKQNGNGEA